MHSIAPPRWEARRGTKLGVGSELLLKCAHVSNQRFDLIVRQLVFVGIHLFFALLNNAILDDFDGVLILHFRLHLLIGVVLYPRLPPHLGVALAVSAMALLALLFPVLLYVGGSERSSSDE